MRPIKLLTDVQTGIMNSVVRTYREVAHTTDEGGEDADKLLALGPQLNRILLATAIQAIQQVANVPVPPPDEDGNTPKKQEFRVLLRVEAGQESGARSYYSSVHDIADVSMSASVDNGALSDRELLSRIIEGILAPVTTLVQELLVANDLMRPIPEVVLGDAAEELAQTLTAASSAWDLKTRIEEAIDEKARAEAGLAGAMQRLADVTASMQAASTPREEG